MKITILSLLIALALSLPTREACDCKMDEARAVVATMECTLLAMRTADDDRPTQEVVEGIVRCVREKLGR